MKKCNRPWSIAFKRNQRYTIVKLLVLILFMTCISQVKAEEITIFDGFESPEINGFIELRSGFRTQNDPYEKDISIMEQRGQIEVFTYNETLDFSIKAILSLIM